MVYTLSTVLCTVAAVVAVWCAVVARQEAQRCEAFAGRLRAATGRITALEGSLDSLQTQVQKLRGTFYAYKAARDAEPATDFALDFAPAPVTTSGGGCENYIQAQMDGPGSKAARCECAYCAGMRARRDALRREVVPKTAQGQARLARLNAGQSDEG
jgi:hypothetical protein